MSFKYPLIAVVFLLCSACNRNFREMIPVSDMLFNGSSFAYSDTVWTNNKTLVRRTANRSVKMVRISMNNQIGLPFTINDSLIEAFADYEPTELYSRKKVLKKLKYGMLPVYPLLLVGMAGFYHNEEIGEYTEVTEFYPGYVSYSSGALAVSYITYAKNFNTKLKRELNKNYLYGKTVLPGETITGYIAVKAKLGSKILMRVKQ